MREREKERERKREKIKDDMMKKLLKEKKSRFFLI